MAKNGEPKSLAVLIDADNTSTRYARAIFEEIVKFGEANVRRIYGDFSGSRLSGWDSAIQSLAMLQHQQRHCHWEQLGGGCQRKRSGHSMLASSCSLVYHHSGVDSSSSLAPSGNIRLWLPTY